MKFIPDFFRSAFRLTRLVFACLFTGAIVLVALAGAGAFARVAWHCLHFGYRSIP